jgi:23S rRNA (guanosine2251-2'-O)-methyltransferase
VRENIARTGEYAILHPMILVAHNIRSLHNVGAIFRNAAAFGVEKLYLTGFTATPPRKEIAKVALGAQDLVPWEGGEIGQVIASLRATGSKIFGLDNAPGSVDIGTLETLATPAALETLVLILGNENDGIDTETQSLLDGLVHIPMAQKQSLNVSVASGVALYALQPHL